MLRLWTKLEPRLIQARKKKLVADSLAGPATITRAICYADGHAVAAVLNVSIASVPAFDVVASTLRASVMVRTLTHKRAVDQF